MAKEKSASGTTILQGLFQVGVYKGTQGRITRQVTFAVLAVTFALGSWQLYGALRVSSTVPNFWEWVLSFFMSTDTDSAKEAVAAWVERLQDVFVFGLPLLLVCGGVWFSYRLVNLPRFADFLVAVEAEMNKVSWPSRTELFRSSVVVIVVIFSLAAILFGYDQLWNLLFKGLGILK